MSEEEMLEEIKSLSPSEQAILTILIRYQNLKAELEKEKEKNKRLRQCHLRYEEMTGIDLLLADKEE